VASRASKQQRRRARPPPRTSATRRSPGPRGQQPPIHSQTVDGKTSFPATRSNQARFGRFAQCADSATAAGPTAAVRRELGGLVVLAARCGTLVCGDQMLVPPRLRESPMCLLAARPVVTCKRTTLPLARRSSHPCRRPAASLKDETGESYLAADDPVLQVTSRCLPQSRRDRFARPMKVKGLMGSFRACGRVCAALVLPPGSAWGRQTRALAWWVSVFAQLVAAPGLRRGEAGRRFSGGRG
jgi:hypothetical protein